VAFPSGGTTLAAGGADDAAVRLWDLGLVAELRVEVVERACAQTGTGLDEENWKIYAPDVPHRQTCPA
jgi:hypothetical protein